MERAELVLQVGVALGGGDNAVLEAHIDKCCMEDLSRRPGLDRVAGTENDAVIAL
jgi:hypothetical protein